ncbi:hypothetical protein [Flavisolibacter ginsenosidimutans]|uniref:Uncharacterized protein n=1 Tax=Flavisolibacter ginsenosidimutans TaxID=661481 RepID=A0A5B8UIQ0_9BACT|nr:hypothetical protein [Flavisolibacter ginsenosidimutans]QEC55885.1 hypothetical protein FSB75_08245 [Flavisolibacter ginsenosidimutans]
MKQKDAATLLNATAIVLLLLASVVFHVQRALNAKKKTPAAFGKSLHFSEAACCATFLPAFPALLLTHENFSHHKPNQKCVM